MGKNMDKASGKAKKTVGKMTNNKSMQAKGYYEEGKGKLKDAMDGPDTTDNYSVADDY